MSSSDYLEEEDPLLYKSKKTGRGPMKENWLEQYKADKPPSDVMCAYKLIKVEFRYWGMQVSIYTEVSQGMLLIWYETINNCLARWRLGA